MKPMRSVRLTGTDLDVSALCLGAGPFGDATDEASARARLDRFLAAGGTFVDTANVYGKWRPEGTNASERILGRWLRDLPPSERARFVVATKGGHPPLSDFRRSRLDRASIAADLDESLSALGLPRIDLYWLHRDDPRQDAGAIVDLMEGFVAEGLVRRWGVSNWRAHRIEAARRHAERRGVAGPAAVQNQWSLARPACDPEGDPTRVQMDGTLYAMHVRSGLAAVPYSAMAHGYLTRRIAAGTGGPPLPDGLAKEYRDPLTERRAAAAKALADERGVPVSQLALAFLAHQPFPTVPIVSFSRLGQLDDAIAAVSLSLSPEEAARLGCGEAW